MKLKHLEVEGCIVNIREGLHNLEGQKVTSIEIIPDAYGENIWKLDGCHNSRVIKEDKEGE